MSYNSILTINLIESILLSLFFCIAGIIPINRMVRKMELKKLKQQSKKKIKKIQLKKNILIVEAIICAVLTIGLTYGALADFVERQYYTHNGVITRLENNKDGFFSKVIYIDNEPYYLPRHFIKSEQIIEGKKYEVVFTKRERLILEIRGK